mmetsp:Transcript_19853/g.31789  ORF Transcript_19853/g.31789 Transcript_19853/m.31789 type:complete len:100 (-) Transcript_19853:687-986(-)
MNMRVHQVVGAVDVPLRPAYPAQIAGWWTEKQRGCIPILSGIGCDCWVTQIGCWVTKKAVLTLAQNTCHQSSLFAECCQFPELLHVGVGRYSVISRDFS